MVGEGGGGFSCHLIGQGRGFDSHASSVFRLLGTIPCNRLVGIVVRRPPREQKILGSNPASPGIFFGVDRVIPVTQELAPGVIGSAVGLVGPVSVYCDWVR